MPEPKDPPADGGSGTEEEKPLVGIHAALAKARETLADKGTLAGSGDEPDDDDPPADDDDSADDDTDDDDDDAGDDDDDDDDDDADDDADDDDDDDDDDDEAEAGGADDDDDDDDDSEEGSEEDDDDDKERFIATLPGRGPDDDDIEIEVDDQATADRINHLRNGFMRGEQIRAATQDLQVAQEELYKIEEQFSFDPAGFVLDNVGEKNMGTVALGVLVDPRVWKAIEPTIKTLIDNPSELRTLQAEAKAARLETREELKVAAQARKEQNENASVLRDAIDMMVPDTMVTAKRDSLMKDITRDVIEHIARHNLTNLEPKDLPTIVAERLELNGIDPLEARKALKDGKPNRAKVSTKKGSKKKAKSGKQLRRASARRKKVAAAPGPGKKVAPTKTKKLPAGQTIQERIKEVRKRGLAAIMGNR